MARRRIQLTRQEMIHLLQAVAVELGPNLSLEEYVEQTGVPRGRVYTLFESWGDLKRQAGLPQYHPRRQLYSDEDLLLALHDFIERHKRFPKRYEMAQQGVSYVAMYNRWGNMKNVEAHYRRWHKERQENGEEDLDAPLNQQYNRTADMPDSELEDLRWLRRTWQSMKVGFELTSSDFENRPHWDCDLLVVLRHDWLGCPAKVIELCDVLPQHKDKEPPVVGDQYLRIEDTSSHRKER